MKLLQKTYPLIKMFWGLPRVQCTKNRLVCKNYIANYTFFPEHQLNSTIFPVFPRAIWNCRRFPGVVFTLLYQQELSVSKRQLLFPYDDGFLSMCVAASEVLCVFWRMAGWHRTSTVQRPVRRGSRWWKNAALSDCCMYWCYLYSLPLDLPSVLWYC